MKDFALVRQSKLKVNYSNSENILLKNLVYSEKIIFIFKIVIDAINNHILS